MWQEVIQASASSGGTLKSGTFTGNNSGSITITLADNFSDVISITGFKTSGATTSAVMSFFYDKNADKYGIVTNSSSYGTLNTALTFNATGKSVTINFGTSFKFINNATYKYYYVV